MNLRAFSQVSLALGAVAALAVAGSAYASTGTAQQAAAAPGVTALSGRVLSTSGAPLAGVVVRDHGRRTVTDRDGNFLLPGLPDGRSVLVIDGRHSGSGGKTDYGYYEVGVEAASGVTTRLPFTSYLPKIDHAHEVAIISPTKAEVVVKTPAFPGLELHIPKGAILTDPDGKPVTRVGLTPIPIDRTPFPIPPDRKMPVYFTIQPGGATIIGADGTWLGAQVWYPNATHALPGARAAFSHYDPDRGVWEHYGEGVVTADGGQVKPDPGTRLYEFTASSLPFPTTPAGLFPPCGCDDADPVNLPSGLWTERWTDLAVSDVLPIDLARTYQSGDFNVRHFGVGMDFGFGEYLYWTGTPSTIDLVLPFSVRMHFACVASCSADPTTGLYRELTQPGQFFDASLEYSAGAAAYLVTTKDGTAYTFNGGTGQLMSWQDRYGDRVTIQGAANDPPLITGIISPNGRTISFTYDPSNSVITQAQDNLGRTVSYAYDGSKRLIQVTDADGGIWTYGWDASNHIKTVTDPRNNVIVTNLYDATNRVTTQTAADGGIYSFAYTGGGSNAFNTETDVTDPIGTLKKVTFNAAGYATTYNLAVGTAQEQDNSVTRDPASNLPQSLTDALGRVTSLGYDSQGNVTSITRLFGTPNAVTTTLTYGAFAQLASVIDPLGHTTTIGLTALGSAASFADPLGDTTTLGYAIEPYVSTITDPLGNATSFTYDLGLLASATDPLGHASTRYTDAIGRTLSTSDPLGNKATASYDPLYGAHQVTQPKGEATTINYLPAGLVGSIVDARTGTTSYAYDAKYRLTIRTDPLGRTDQVTAYDDNDNVLTRIDRKGQAATYTYDPLNRTSTATYADGAVVSYTWDKGDRLTQIQDSSSGTITRTYDGLDNLLSETTPQGTVSYTYDAANRRSTMTASGQTPVSYTYDNANRLTQISQGSATVTIGYDVAGRRTSLTLPNGIVASYSYDSASELTGMSYSLGSTVLGTLTYGYDAAGHQTSRGGTLFQSVLPNPVTSGSYDVANRLNQWTTPGGGVSPSYDTNGNLLNDGTRTYTWDARNRLTGITGVASFTYDALGRRQSGTINGNTVAYLYDGSDPVQEQSGGAVMANILIGMGVDERFTRTEGSTASAYLTDALGSSVALADSSGVVKTSYGYDPYGNTGATGTANDNSYQYAGRQNDGTGLYYNRARYYNPAWGRFISEDPLSEPWRDPLGLFGGIVPHLGVSAIATNRPGTLTALGQGNDLYAYTGGNPISRRDPSGLLWVCARAEPGSGFWICYHVPDSPDPPLITFPDRFGGFQIWNSPCVGLFCAFSDCDFKKAENRGPPGQGDPI
jgi:RHS repeat-associated protein